MTISRVLPSGWTSSCLAEIAVAQGGGTPSRSDANFWANGTVPWVSPKDMKSRVLSSSEDLITERALAKLTLVPSQSVLIVVRSGILSRTLPVALNAVPVTINQDMRAFVPEAGIEARFAAWQLIWREGEILSACSKNGTTVASIEGPALARFPLHVAPTAEQARIVDKLEELLSDLDAGVAELKAAQKKLAQYRQSLLKAAVEGALTTNWRTRRAARGESLETGADLLARILTERRARWEARQLAKFKEQGKPLPKGWETRYPEPPPPHTADLPVLPEGWVWASAEQLCDFITKGTTPPKDIDQGDERNIPFLRVTNLTENGTLDFSDRVFVSEPVHRGFLGRSVVYPGDVLMNIVGPPLGQVSVVPEMFSEWNINQAIAIFRAVEGVSPSFLCSYLLSPVARKWLKQRAKTTAGQTNLTLEVCRGLPVPLPPRDEQEQLSEVIAHALSGTDQQTEAVLKGLEQAAAQRKNLLKAAFSGQLVPQDPDDEPASALLARIRAERAANGHNTRRQRQKKETP